MAITYTQSDLDNLKAALVSGAEEVQIGDRKTRFRTQKEILELIAQIEESMSDTESSDSPNMIQTTFKRGGR